MTRRPWRVEQLDAESNWRIAATFNHKDAAELRADRLAHDNPGVQYQVTENVHFEAHKEDV